MILSDLQLTLVVIKFHLPAIIIRVIPYPLLVQFAGRAVQILPQFEI